MDRSRLDWTGWSVKNMGQTLPVSGDTYRVRVRTGFKGDLREVIATYHGLGKWEGGFDPEDVMGWKPLQ